MKIAIPLVAEKLSPHFGHPENFALVDVDSDAGKILKQERVNAPDHQPGYLPAWLKEMAVNVVIAGGMGGRAQMLLEQSGIQVISGEPDASVDKLINAYFDGVLKEGGGPCPGEDDTHKKSCH